MGDAADRLRRLHESLQERANRSTSDMSDFDRMRGALELAIITLDGNDAKIERLTTENASLKVEATCNHCGEYHGREVCEKLRTDYFRMKEALAIIADWYKPNWIPGDTHATVQRLSKIAHKALATVSGSQPHPQREIAAEINEESEPWASRRAAADPVFDRMGIDKDKFRDATADSKQKIICHAEGDTCHGCDHYHGKADVCTYAAESDPQQHKESK